MNDMSPSAAPELPLEVNDQLILVGGKSAGGKSASLRNLRNQERWVYLNTEAGKRLPFRNSFLTQRISEPYEVHGFMEDAIESKDQLDGLIIDSATFMMDMFETQYIYPAVNTQQAWGQYAQFWKHLAQNQIVRFGKPVIIIAHVKDDLNEQTHSMETAVPIKGSLRNNGIEAYFSTVVEALKMPLKDLEDYKNDMLTVIEDEEMLGFKYVFQTRLTKQTVGKRIRSPMGMFSKDETFIDNDCQVLLDHLNRFYGN